MSLGVHENSCGRACKRDNHNAQRSPLLALIQLLVSGNAGLSIPGIAAGGVPSGNRRQHLFSTCPFQPTSSPSPPLCRRDSPALHPPFTLFTLISGTFAYISLMDQWRSSANADFCCIAFVNFRRGARVPSFGTQGCRNGNPTSPCDHSTARLGSFALRKMNVRTIQGITVCPLVFGNQQSEIGRNGVSPSGSHLTLVRDHLEQLVGCIRAWSLQLVT